MDEKLSHLDRNNQPSMVDVSGKAVTRRVARAGAVVQLTPELAVLFKDGDVRGPKGPVFQTAILAGVMAAKKTSDLIPLCHPLPLHDCQVRIHLEENRAIIEATAVTDARTGVEMEALTAASVAALTIYDMGKALGPGMVVREIRLLEKTGGKRDFGEPAADAVD